jgi:NADH dehydrogenase
MVAMLKSAVGSKAFVLHIPPAAMWLAADLIGKVTGDVLLTRDEVKGLMADLLVSQASPTAAGRLSEWVHQHAAEVGQHYASEIARRRQPQPSG